MKDFLVHGVMIAEEIVRGIRRRVDFEKASIFFVSHTNLYHDFFHKKNHFQQEQVNFTIKNSIS